MNLNVLYFNLEVNIIETLKIEINNKVDNLPPGFK